MRPFFVYMLRCADGTQYTGHTDDLEQRLASHRRGLVPGFTSRRRPVRLVFAQEFATRAEALAQERRIKGWSRAKKHALIGEDWPALRGWSARRRRVGRGGG